MHATLVEPTRILNAQAGSRYSIIPVSRVEYSNRSTTQQSISSFHFFIIFFFFIHFKFFFPFFHFSLNLCVGTNCCCIPEFMLRLILCVIFVQHWDCIVFIKCSKKLLPSLNIAISLKTFDILISSCYSLTKFISSEV